MCPAPTLTAAAAAFDKEPRRPGLLDRLEFIDMLTEMNYVDV